MSSVKYPIGIQSFSEIRNNGYLYVDKTRFVYDLVSRGKYYFLSRPRRFGKSLLLSTIEAFFLGKRELFKGLAIDSMDWDWQEYPVIHLDLNGMDYSEEDALACRLGYQFGRLEQGLGIEIPQKGIQLRLIDVIHKLHDAAGRNVVILIDEYDKPLPDTLHDRKLNETNRNALQAFYSVLKTMDPYIKFAFLTGVTRFGKVSVFSGLNNLKDLSLLPQYNSICGITEAELSEYFVDGIEALAREKQIGVREARTLLKSNYDGYHFSEKMEDVYNPFSLLNTFDSQAFKAYWFNTGTPTFLVHLLEQGKFTLPEMDGYHCKEELLTGSDVYLKDPIPIFYQSGYLTIKGYDSRFNEYILGFPNKEVSQGFVDYLMKSYFQGGSNTMPLTDFVLDVENGRPQEFMETLQRFLAGIPYDHIKGTKEMHFENIMFIIFKLMGFHVHTELRTSDGRIDMVVETKDYVYVFEFKLKGNAATAMRQLNERGYALRFLNGGRKVWKIAAAFSTRTNRLSRFLIEEA